MSKYTFTLSFESSGIESCRDCPGRIELPVSERPACAYKRFDRYVRLKDHESHKRPDWCPLEKDK